jgi:hypothetical protein
MFFLRKKYLQKTEYQYFIEKLNFYAEKFFYLQKKYYLCTRNKWWI